MLVKFCLPALAAALALSVVTPDGALAQSIAKDDDSILAETLHAEADKGNARAQYNLGMMYISGRGVTQDDAQAIAWWRKAAERGDADAEYSLGRMYTGGRGIAKDRDQAVAWYRKAADQGHGGAQEMLNEMEATGSIK